MKVLQYCMLCLQFHWFICFNRKALETLAQTRADARTTQDSIRNLTEQFEEAKTTASDLLERLTSRTSALESLKGQLGKL